MIQTGGIDFHSPQPTSSETGPPSNLIQTERYLSFYFPGSPRA
jgi:hypothetical protein